MPTARSQRGVRATLLTAFVVILGLAAALGAVALAQMRTINGAALDIAGTHLPGVIVVGEIGQLVEHHRFLQVRHSLSTSHEEKAQIDAQLVETEARVGELFELFESTYAVDDDDLDLLAAAREAWRAYLGSSTLILSLSRADESDAAVAAAIGDSQGRYDDLAGILIDWRAESEAAAARSIDTSRSTFRSAQAFVVGAIVVVVIAGLVIATWVARLFKRYQGGTAEALRSAEVEAERALVFARLSDRLAFAIDEADLVKAALAALQRLLPTARGDLLLLNPSQDRLVVAGAWGDTSPELGAPVPIDRPGLCPGIRRGTVYRAADAADELAVRCLAHPIERGSLLCVPMLAMGEVVGVIHLEQPEADAFDAASQQLVSRAAEQTALALANARLMRRMEGQAMTDPLTGLHNARFMDRLLDHELAAAERDRSPLGVVMIDLDHFKQFNDTHGHPAGDEALKAFAKAVRSAVRESDSVARYGGEEFVVALRGADLGAATTVAEKIRRAIEHQVVEIGPGRFARISASLGVASTAVHGADRLSLLRVADRALYRAKELGRNRVVAADAALVNLDGNAPATMPPDVAVGNGIARGRKPAPPALRAVADA